MNKDCIFCKIVESEIPSHKIHENDDFFAFLDISNFTDGHTLAIPKKHFRFVWDVDNIGDYFEFCKEIAQHYTENLGFEYVDTLIMGRMVPHAHVHLIPHNGERSDWEKALSSIGDMQQDTDRRLSESEGEIIAKKFAL